MDHWIHITLTFCTLLCTCFTVDAVCNNGWAVYDESCYLFLKIKEAWPVAEAHCKALGGDLVEITSASENHFVDSQAQTLLGSSGEAFWTGGTDVVVHGEWMWAHSNTHLSFSDWYPGQPASVASEHCLALHSSKDRVQWHDYPCTSANFFICERMYEPQVDGVVG